MMSLWHHGKVMGKYRGWWCCVKMVASSMRSVRPLYPSYKCLQGTPWVQLVQPVTPGRLFLYSRRMSQRQMRWVPLTCLLPPLSTDCIIIPLPPHLTTIFAISCDFRTPTWPLWNLTVLPSLRDSKVPTIPSHNPTSISPSVATVSTATFDFDKILQSDHMISALSGPLLVRTCSFPPDRDYPIFPHLSWSLIPMIFYFILCFLLRSQVPIPTVATHTSLFHHDSSRFPISHFSFQICCTLYFPCLACHLGLPFVPIGLSDL